MKLYHAARVLRIVFDFWTIVSNKYCLNQIIRDRLVLGCKDTHARAKLFTERECDLKKEQEVLRIHEATKQQLRNMTREGKVNKMTSKEMEREQT